MWPALLGGFDVNGSVKRLTQDRPKPWRARYRGPDGRERSRRFARKVHAERWLRDELGKVDRGLWVDPTAGAATSFAEWADGWLRGLTLKPKTRAGHESLLRSRVLPRFGAFPLAKITPAEVRAWHTGMLDEGLSPARVRQARQVLHAALEQAVATGWSPGIRQSG
jgi:hypothetical protein